MKVNNKKIAIIVFCQILMISMLFCPMEKNYDLLSAKSRSVAKPVIYSPFLMDDSEKNHNKESVVIYISYDKNGLKPDGYEILRDDGLVDYLKCSGKKYDIYEDELVDNKYYEYEIRSYKYIDGIKVYNIDIIEKDKDGELKDNRVYTCQIKNNLYPTMEATIVEAYLDNSDETRYYVKLTNKGQYPVIAGESIDLYTSDLKNKIKAWGLGGDNLERCIEGGEDPGEYAEVFLQPGDWCYYRIEKKWNKNNKNIIIDTLIEVTLIDKDPMEGKAGEFSLRLKNKIKKVII